MASNSKLLSKPGIASVGVVVATAGVTVATAAQGPQSAAYYALVLSGLVCTLPFLFIGTRRNLMIACRVISVALIPFIVYLAQVSSMIGRSAQLDLLPAAAMCAVLFLVSVAALLPPLHFRRAVGSVAVVHAILCAYALLQPDAAPQSLDARFSGLNLDTAVWGEIGVGMLAAAVLARSRAILLGCLSLAAIMIFLTEMRGMGVAAAGMLFVHSWAGIKRRLGSFALLAFSICSAFLLVLMRDDIINGMKSILLWNDPYRGLQSGLSGRFENWSTGIELFLSAPIVGVGAGSTDIHNGYIKMAAEQGIFFFLCFLLVLVASGLRALRFRQWSLLSVIIGYSLYLGSTPRYINFQVMPLLGLVAIGAALVWRRGDREPNGSTKSTSPDSKSPRNGNRLRQRPFSAIKNV